MQMTVYSVQPEEIPIFHRLEAETGCRFTLVDAPPTPENDHFLQGADAVNVISSVVITPEIWDAWKASGIRLAVTRTIGDEHMNRTYGESLGIPVYRITYSPASVADFAIMLMLMVLRNVKPTLLRYAGGDYTVSGLRGRELPELTVGVLGAGRIGSTVIGHLQGFGCRVLYWSRTRKPELESLAEYRELDGLLAESDVLSLHLAAVPETLHLLDRDRIFSMKPGAVLINTARGTLVDSEALIEALEQGHLSGAGLDVFDGDRTIYYRDFKNTPVHHRQMAILNAMPNVLMLPHIAYYTDRAVEDMVVHSVEQALAALAENG